ncbi:MAG TPA: histidinol-phosphate transaminase [Ktedonobacterales bacterium]
MQSMKCAAVSVRPELERVAPYEPGESLAAFSARVGIPVERLIKLNSNENPYGPSPRVMEALGAYTRYNLYPDPAAPALRAALEQYTHVPNEYIFLSNGSNELIQLLWQAFLNPGDSVLLCPPTFSLYATVTSICSGTLATVPRRPDCSVDPEAIRAALRPDTRIIILCSPNNPTGNLMPLADIEALLNTGRIVVVDEAYIEFTNAMDCFSAAQLVPRYDNLVALRTFSKWAGLAGLRLGYGLFPPWMIPHLLKLQLPFEVNVAAHIAALETLADLEYVRDNITRIVAERARVYDLLAAQPFLCALPSEANFILAYLSDERVQISDVRAAMESEGILVRFFRAPDLARAFRVSVGAPADTEALARALAKIEPAWRS